MGFYDVAMDWVNQGKGNRFLSKVKQPATTSLGEYSNSLFTASDFTFEAPAYFDGNNFPIAATLKNTRPFIIRAMPDFATRKLITPELVLLVNPKDLVVQMNKNQTSRFTRGGWSVEKWGDEHDQINGSGTTGGFYSLKRGLIESFAEISGGLQNLYALLLHYKNNGVVYYPKLKDQLSLVTSYQGEFSLDKIKKVGELQIHYGQTIWYGSFNSFQITNSADNPFFQTYTFDFDVRRTQYKDSPEREY